MSSNKRRRDLSIHDVKCLNPTDQSWLAVWRNRCDQTEVNYVGGMYQQIDCSRNRQAKRKVKTRLYRHWSSRLVMWCSPWDQGLGLESLRGQKKSLRLCLGLELWSLRRGLEHLVLVLVMVLVLKNKSCTSLRIFKTLVVILWYWQP